MIIFVLNNKDNNILKIILKKLKIIIFYIELRFFNLKNNVTTNIIILNIISYFQYINIFMT